MKQEENTLSWSEFAKVEMLVGTVVQAEIFKEALNPAIKMLIDFGPLGVKKTSAQLTKLYTPDALIGKQVVAVVNFPKKQIATIMSECLVLGGLGDDKEVTIISPERMVLNGTKIG